MLRHKASKLEHNQSSICSKVSFSTLTVCLADVPTTIKIESSGAIDLSLDHTDDMGRGVLGRSGRLSLFLPLFLWLTRGGVRSMGTSPAFWTTGVRGPSNT